MESAVQLRWAYPNKRQSAYATPNPDADINQSHPFEGADIADHVPNMSDNAAMFGKGHEFATRNEILSWDVRFRRTFHATTKILGWAFAFHTGKITTTALGGSPAAYQHVFEYQDPLGAGYYGSGRQQPCATIVEQSTSGLTRRFPSIQVMAVEVTGANNDWIRVAMELIGSGKKTDASGFSFPESVEGTLLRNASLLFEHGPSGSLSDMSCDIKSWRFRSELSYFEEDGYCPGSGYQTPGDPSSGQVRSKLEFNRRAVLFEFVARASASSPLHARLEAGTELYALLTVEGSNISGANDHALVIRMPRMKYRAVPIQVDGDQIVFAVSAIVFYDTDLANPFEVEVVNDIASYLVSS